MIKDHLKVRILVPKVCNYKRARDKAPYIQKLNTDTTDEL